MSKMGRLPELVAAMYYTSLKEEYRDAVGVVCTACLVVVAVFYNEIMSCFLSFVASKSARRNDKEMKRQARQQKRQLRTLQRQLDRHLRDLQKKEAQQRKAAERKAASEGSSSTKECSEPKERVDAIASRSEQLFDESTSPTQSIQSSFEHLASGSNDHFNDSMYQDGRDEIDASKLKLDESEEMETAQLSTSDRMDDLSDHMSCGSDGGLAGVIDSYGSLPVGNNTPLSSAETLPLAELLPDDGDDDACTPDVSKRHSTESLPGLMDYDRGRHPPVGTPVSPPAKKEGGKRKSVVTISLDDRPSMGENSKSSDGGGPEAKSSVDVERFKTISNSMRTNVRRRTSIKNLHAPPPSARFSTANPYGPAANRSSTALLSVTEAAALVSEDLASTDSESHNHIRQRASSNMIFNRTLSGHSQNSNLKTSKSGRSADGMSPSGLSQLKSIGGSTSTRNMMTGKSMRNLGKKMRSERALIKPRKQRSFGSKDHQHNHSSKRGSIIDRVRNFKQIKEELRHGDYEEPRTEQHEPPKRQQRRLSIGDEMILNQIEQQPRKKGLPGRQVVSFDRVTGNPALSEDMKAALGYE